MSGELVIKNLLEASAGVTSLVSTRIYAEARPEDDPLPTIVYFTISDTPDPPINAGPGAEPCTARVQVDALGLTVADAEAVRAAAIAACHGRSGTFGGYKVMAVLQDNARSGGYDAMVSTFSRLVDFIVHYQR